MCLLSAVMFSSSSHSNLSIFVTQIQMFAFACQTVDDNCVFLFLFFFYNERTIACPVWFPPHASHLIDPKCSTKSRQQHENLNVCFLERFPLSRRANSSTAPSSLLCHLHFHFLSCHFSSFSALVKMTASI